MSGREERIARNEATSREINERLEDAHRRRSGDRTIRMVCECGRETCVRVIAITLTEYDRVRANPLYFVVTKGHVVEDVDRVVDRAERYVVVAKREGTPAKVAEEEDPRD